MKFKLKLIKYADDNMYAVMEQNVDPGEAHTVVKEELEIDIAVPDENS
jgi:hypothetical protein